MSLNYCPAKNNGTLLFRTTTIVDFLALLLLFVILTEVELNVNNLLLTELNFEIKFT